MIDKNIRFWGHNCFSIQSKKSILVTDPWFSNTGAFLGSWFQYPKNHHLRSEILKLISESQRAYIYISHEHEDHYDQEFISSLPSSSELLIPNYRDKTFLNQCKKISKNVLEISDNVSYSINDELSIRLFVADIGMNHDSAIFIKTKNFTFLNQNDCKIFDRLEYIEEKIDYYSVQFSGAAWHPSSFDFPEDRKKLISKKKIQIKFDNILSALTILKPKYFLPAAGPAIFPFLDKKLSFGKNNIFIHQDNFNKFAIENNINNSIYLRPGDAFNSNKKNPIMPPSTEAEIEEYKKDIINYWESIEYNFDRLELEKIIAIRLEEIIDIEFTNLPIIIFNFGSKFDDTDQSNKTKIFIDVSSKRILSSFNYEFDYQEIVADEKYFSLMCTERWQNIILSFRATVVRRPDTFNNNTNIFLFSDVSNIYDNFFYTIKISKERLVVQNSLGQDFEIDRFCPHQGADLCNAQISNENILTCPRHGWKFDLSNNGLDMKSGMSINSSSSSKIKINS